MHFSWQSLFFVAILALLLIESLSISALPENPNLKNMITGIQNPYGIAVNPNTSRIYVANWAPTSAGLANATIFVIDGYSNKIIDAIKIGQAPDPQVVVNPQTNKMYVSSGPAGYPMFNKVVVLDGTTDTVVDNISISAPSLLAINPNTNTVYVAHWNYPKGSLYVVNGSNDKIIANLNFVDPLTVAVNTNSNRVYVTTEDNTHLLTSLSVIDGSTNNLIASNITSICPPKTYAWGCGESASIVNPNTNKFYVASIGSGPPNAGMPPPLPSSVNAMLYILDGSTNKVLTNFMLPYPTGMAVNPTTNKVYILSGYNNRVTVIDGLNDTVVSTIMPMETNANGNYGIAGRIAVNPNTNTIYVTNTFSNFVSVINEVTNMSVSNPPLKQLKAGISLHDVKCNVDMQLVFKTEDKSPACVKPDTAQKLVERGWGVSKEQLVWFTYNYIKCQNTPWYEDWRISVISAEGTTQFKPPPDDELITTFFNKQGITILEAKQTPPLSSNLGMPPMPCGSPSGFVYFLISGSDADKMVKLGYTRLTTPLPLETITIR